MLKNTLYTILTILILLLLTLDFLPTISIYGVIPNILLIYIIFISQKRGSMKAQITGFYIGFILDLFSLYTGITSLAMLILGYIAGRLQRHFFIIGLHAQTAILVFFLSLFYNFLYLVLSHFFIKTDVFHLHAFVMIFVKSMYTALVAPLLFMIFSFFYTLREQ